MKITRALRVGKMGQAAVQCKMHSAQFKMGRKLMDLNVWAGNSTLGACRELVVRRFILLRR